MTKHIEIEFTPLGLAFAQAKSSPEEVKSRFWAEMMQDNLQAENVIWHTIMIGNPDDEIGFIFTPKNDDQGNVIALICDALEFEDIEPPPDMPEPFAGKLIRMPRPASQDRDSSSK